MRNVRRNILLSYFISVLFLNLNCTEAQVYSDSDVELCNSKFQIAASEEWQKMQIGEIMAEVGKSFIGTDYLAHGIEKEGDEELVINLTGLDCTTLVENTLAISRCIKYNRTSFEDYKKELQNIRYRNAIMDGYPSRLHYFSDWIYNNTVKGILRNVTTRLGGEEIKFNLSFMSSNPDLYPRLKENPDFVETITQQEIDISKRKLSYIPKDKIKQAEEKIINGDIIAFTSDIKGLDVNHVGLAIKKDDGRVYLLHAPDVGKEVQISETPLAEYVNMGKRNTGIMVARATEVTALNEN